MSRNKRKVRTPEGEWESFVTKMLNRERENREFTLPLTYLSSLADNLHRTNPSKEIILNTLKELSEVLAEKFYSKGIQDRRFFRSKQEAHRKQDFNKFKDHIDDLIHNKSK